MTIKSAAQDISVQQARISKIKELLKEYSESNEEVQKLKDINKENTAQMKAILLSDVDYFALVEEQKGIIKEIKQAAKVATKDTSYKPALYLAFLAAKLKEDGVDKVKMKGSVFSRLDQEI
jgi:hypothetical protein